MGTFDNSEMLIKPQVKPATNAVPNTSLEDAEEAKRKRIEEALKHYETHLAQQPSSTITLDGKTLPAGASHGHADRPGHVANQSSEPQSSQNKKQYILQHPAEAMAVLGQKYVMHQEPIPKPEYHPKTVAPTQIEKDATIAAAAEALRKEREAQAAAEAAKREIEAKRYHASDNPLHVIAGSKKKYVIALAMWLAAVPLAIILYSLVSVIFKYNVPLAVNVSVTIILYPLGIYGLLGWIPLVVFYMREHNDW